MDRREGRRDPRIHNETGWHWDQGRCMASAGTDFADLAQIGN
jgi:hypothetical protein